MAKKFYAAFPKARAMTRDVDAAKVPTKFPELDTIARAIADETCAAINKRALPVKSKMPYKAQYTLEEVIKILEERV